LKREIEPGFEPVHKVPVTAPGGQLIKKPKKPKKPKEQGRKGKSRIHLGNWFEEK